MKIIPYITEKFIIQHTSDFAKKYHEKHLELKRLNMVYILEGSRKFFDLVKQQLKQQNPLLKIYEYPILINTYENTKSTREPRILNEDILNDIRNMDTLLIDDICDTGRTLLYAKQSLHTFIQPKYIKTLVMLNKQDNRKVNITPDYVLFDIINAFVVGYGLDYNQEYRDLNYIGILDLSDEKEPIVDKV